MSEQTVLNQIPQQVNYTSSPTILQRVGLVCMVSILLVFGILMLEGFLKALAWACIFALALNPVYQKVLNTYPKVRGKHNVLLPLCFTLAVAFVFLIPLVLLGVEVGKEASNVMELVKNYRQNGIMVPDFVHSIPWIGNSIADWWQLNLSDSEGMHSALARIDHDKIVSLSSTFGTNLLHRIVNFVLSLLTLFFLFKDGDILGKQMYVAADRLFGHHGALVGKQIVNSIHGTVNGLVLVGIGEGILIGIAYGFAGVPHAVLFGAATAIASMIPLGAPLIIGIAVLTLFAKASTVAAISVIIVGVIVTFIADHMIRPVLIGGSSNLPFIWVLLGTLGGVETFGLLGLFLGPAIMAALILMWRELVNKPKVI